MGGKKARGRQQAPAQRGKKSKSGNPAKRAAEQRAAIDAPPAAPGSSFGVGKPADSQAPLELPPGLEKFLGR